MSRLQRRLLWIVWTLEGLALSPLFVWYMDGHWPTWAQHSRLFYYLFLPYAVFYWIMLGFATLYCIPLGIAISAVTLSPDIRTRTKFLVCVGGVLSYLSLLYWARAARYTG